MLSLIPIVRSDRRRNGAFVNGWRVGWTLPVTIIGRPVHGRDDDVVDLGPARSRPLARWMIAGPARFAMLHGCSSIVWKRIYVAEA